MTQTITAQQQNEIFSAGQQEEFQQFADAFKLRCPIHHPQTDLANINAVEQKIDGEAMPQHFRCEPHRHANAGLLQSWSMCLSRFLAVSSEKPNTRLRRFGQQVTR